MFVVFVRVYSLIVFVVFVASLLYSVYLMGSLLWDHYYGVGSTVFIVYVVCSIYSSQVLIHRL